jgi:hypothetical protein
MSVRQSSPFIAKEPCARPVQRSSVSREAVLQRRHDAIAVMDEAGVVLDDARLSKRTTPGNAALGATAAVGRVARRA